MFHSGGLEARHVDLLPLGGGLLHAVQPGVPQRDGAAPVQGHDGGGRVVQHGLNPAVGLVHRVGDGLGDLGHGQPVVGVAEFGVDLRQLLLGGDHRRAGLFQPGGKLFFCHLLSPPSQRAVGAAPPPEADAAEMLHLCKIYAGKLQKSII